MDSPVESRNGGVLGSGGWISNGGEHSLGFLENEKL